MTAHTDPEMPERFTHAALIIDSDQTLHRLLVPLLRAQVAVGQPVLMVVSPHTEWVLRARLQDDAQALEWGAPGAFYQRLGLTFEGFRRYLQRRHAQGRSVHVVAEPDVPTELDCPVDRVAAYLSYEALCNEAYAAFGCPVTCIWDSRQHPMLVIEGVRSIHDHEITEHGQRANPSYVAVTDYLAARAQVAMPPVSGALDIEFSVCAPDEMACCRSAVRQWATSHGFSAAASSEITAATHEVLTNGLRHGRAPVRLRAWHHHKTLIVQVDDPGGLPIPPDAGYRPPGHPAHGAGLWIARQLADVLLTHTSSGRTTVRMYFPYDITHWDLHDEPHEPAT